MHIDCCWVATDMHVAICIVGFCNAEQIRQCVDALSESDHADFEIVICENGGADAHARLQSALPPVLAGGQPVAVLLAPGNIGYAGGVNACISAAPDAGAWWVVNPDTAPAPSAMRELLARLALGDCDAVGGTLHYADGTVQGYGGRWHGWMARAESLGKGTRMADRVNPAEVEPKLDYLLGASMLLGRRFVEVNGLMREDYFLYAEEVEWCLRAKRRGLRLGLAPAARILHGQGGTTGSADPIARRPRLPIYLDERNKLNVVRDTTPGRLPVAACAAFVLIVLRYVRRGAWRQAGYALSGWAAGLRNARDFPPWMR